MKAAVTNESGGLRIAELPLPSLHPGQVRVAVTYCGICGSDLHWRRHFPPGTVMGHEIVGTIAECGPGSTGWSIGDRVVVMPVEPCRACDPCSRGWPNLCEDRRYGIGGPRGQGGYAESLVVLDSMPLRIPPTLSDRAAALVEPLAVALHAVGIAETRPDDRVVVLGAGPVGLMTILALRATGTKRIVVIESNPRRCAHAASVGAHGFAADWSVGGLSEVLQGPPTVVFECAGYTAAVSDAVSMVSARGQIVLVSAASAPVPLPQWELIRKEGRITSAVFYTREEFEQAIRLLDMGVVRAEDVPTTVFSLDEAPRALGELLIYGTPHLKVLLAPQV